MTMKDPAPKPIYVTEPLLPPLAEFVPYLEEIWRRKWLTNSGHFHQQFEKALAGYLGVDHVSLFTNATIALVTALQALGVSGEVITTPYSFVATAHSLMWNGIKPVFVDIDPLTLNLDPARIEAAITPQTTGILPVHCYGCPCDVLAIQEIADRHNLKVIYDAAHAFGVGDDRGSLLRFGDLSILSFHATKVFNTFEGGAIISPDPETKTRIDQLKNFGFVDELTVELPGINGKMSEFNAAFGLLQLNYIDDAIAKRQTIDSRYHSLLTGVPGIRFLPNGGGDLRSNYSYFPVLIEEEFPISRDQLYQLFQSRGVIARRYFYPLISDFPLYKALPSARPENLQVASRAASRVLCLPIFPDLEIETQTMIVEIIRSAGRS